MYKDPLQAVLLPLPYPYVQGPTTSSSAASALPLCTRTHYKQFCCLCPTLMYKDPLQAVLLPLPYPYVQGPTTSSSAASALPLCTGTHYKLFCCLCPTLMYRDPLQAVLLPLSYPYVQGPKFTSQGMATCLNTQHEALHSKTDNKPRGDLHVKVIVVALNYLQAHTSWCHLNVGHSLCCHVYHIETETRSTGERLEEDWHSMWFQSKDSTIDDVPNCIQSKK